MTGLLRVYTKIGLKLHVFGDNLAHTKNPYPVIAVQGFEAYKGVSLL